MSEEWSNKILEWYDPIQHTMYAKTKNWADSEDITQNTFYKAIINKSKYNEKASLKSWLFAIAFNELRNYRDKYWRGATLESYIEFNKVRNYKERHLRGGMSFESFTNCLFAKPEYEEPVETLDSKQITYVLKLLPPQQRLALKYRIMQGATWRQSAKLMGIGDSAFQECFKSAIKNARGYWELIKESLEPDEIFNTKIKFLSVSQVAEKMNVCDDVILKMIGQKRLRAVKYHNKFWIRSTWISTNKECNNNV